VEEKTKDFFWPSYVDLLTALFAVVLVLFVLSFKLFRDREKELENGKKKYELYAKQYRRLLDIDRQIQALEREGTFTYDSVYKRFLVKGFMGKEIFTQGSFAIKDEYKPIALQAGREILNLINSFGSNTEISFVVLIEGNTAKQDDGHPKGTIDGNYELSYRRSLALHNLWEENGIRFGNSTEVILSGSGVYGIGRDNTEENNKRFLIQVIPKIRK
jgi:flagellar motor protein MotB